MRSIISDSCLAITCLLVACVTFWEPVVSWPDGAPCGKIDEMDPQHLGGTQEDPPYVLQVRAACYKPNTPVKVILRGKKNGNRGKKYQPFKGFIVQARSAGDNFSGRVGIFLREQSGAETPKWQYQCSKWDDKTSITHTSNEPKEKLTIEWTAKESVENITFVATVVKSYSSFYVGKVISRTIPPCAALAKRLVASKAASKSISREEIKTVDKSKIGGFQHQQQQPSELPSIRTIPVDNEPSPLSAVEESLAPTVDPLKFINQFTRGPSAVNEPSDETSNFQQQQNLPIDLKRARQFEVPSSRLRATEDLEEKRERRPAAKISVTDDQKEQLQPVDNFSPKFENTIKPAPGNRQELGNVESTRQSGSFELAKLPKETSNSKPAEKVEEKKNLPKCEQPADRGEFCLSEYQHEWYHHKGYCYKFWYGGCKGNENRFRTKTECLKACTDDLNELVEKPDDPTAICRLPNDPGDFCGQKYDWAEMWYYENGFCRQFYYAGCEGNQNRFRTKADCEAKCINIDQIDPEVQQICKHRDEDPNCKGWVKPRPGLCDHFGKDYSYYVERKCKRQCCLVRESAKKARTA